MDAQRIAEAAVKALARKQLESVETQVQGRLGGCRCEREARAGGVCHVGAEITHCPSGDVCSVQVMRESGTEDGTGATIEAAFGQLAAEA